MVEVESSIKNNEITKFEKRKLIERIIFFIIIFSGFSFFLIFDLVYSVPYRLDGSHNPWDWMMYWTHLSNIGALIWITFAFIAVIFKSEKIENEIQSWWFKNTVYTFIIVTGIVFMTFAYVPSVIKYSSEENIMGYPDLYNSITIDVERYGNLYIATTTFKHLIIPSIFIYLAFTERNYTKSNRDISVYQKVMLQFILPCLYFVYVLFLASSTTCQPPYAVVDYGFTENVEWWKYIFYIICDLLVGVFFIFVSWFQYYWNNKNN
ncbi:MAG: hypothetical protein TYPL_0200 [Candidatus Tyloplasma litorale]|nr:MAG: hypothetical protein TYPL_0200 [Mycoplasmatales bacterium]